MCPAILWTISDLVDIAKARIENKFDFRMVISGSTGKGKSTLGAKFFYRFPEYKPRINQVYSRKDVMHLLETQRKGLIFDDEGIKSGYKRNFQDKEQKLFIQALNMYRSHFNIYVSSVPSFYSLDKDLRNLMRFHINIIQRGLGVVMISNDDRIYSDDPWDIEYNKKLEEGWAEQRKRNPHFHPPYHRITTFAGYIRFGDLKAKQRRVYEAVKEHKRSLLYHEEIKKEAKKDFTTALQGITTSLLQKTLTKRKLMETFDILGIKPITAKNGIKSILKEKGYEYKIDDLLLPEIKSSKFK